MALLEKIIGFGPFIFAVGFLVPLFAQLITLSGITLPFGATALMGGAVIGIIWGLIAQFKGRWV